MQKTTHNSLALAILCSPALALAQALPDAGRILEQSRPPALVRQPGASAKLLPDAAPVPAVAPDGAQTIVVRRFTVLGASVFSAQALQQVLAPFSGRALTFAGLQQACDALTAHYRAHGYFVAGAMLPAQDIAHGDVTIQVLEGRLSGLQVVAGKDVRLRSELARDYVLAQLPVGQPIQEDRLERGLLLVQDLPGIVPRAELRRGGRQGETALDLQLSEGPLATGSLSLDNAGNRYTGATRLTGNLALNDLGGLGGQLSLLASTAGDGFRYGRAGYVAALGSHGFKAGAAVSRLRYRLGGEFAPLGAHGTASVSQLIATYPLLRTRSTNLQLRAGADDKRYENVANGALTSDKHVRVLPLALAFTRQQDHAAIQASLELSLGHLSLGGDSASAAADAAGARSAGRFAHLTYQLGRLQRLGGRVGLLLGASGQIASRNLESGEKLSLGGPGRVRAYPAGEASGDEGHVLTTELHYEWPSAGAALAAFVDVGHVRLNNGTYAGALGANGPGNSYTLKGAGLGASWRGAGGATLQVQAARKLGRNPAAAARGEDADGKASRVRAWFVASLPF